MGGSILNREDYKTAIPQLSSQLSDLLENNVIINRTVITLSEGKVSDLNTYLGYFQNLTTGYFQAIAGDIEYLSSREAYINHLKTDIASFGYLTAETADLRYATISNLNAAVARIGDLEADHVSVSDLTAATGRISDLEADHVSVSDLTAATGRISDLEADHVSVTDLAATNADVAHLKVGDLTIGGVTVNIYDLAIAIKNSAMASGTTWYKVSASTPTAPAVFDPSADGWSQTEPAYVGGTTDHLYSCLRVVYADDDPLGTRHFQWSDVHMIQSWEAAKSAYTYADSAYDYAEAAAEAAESALINLSQVEDVVGVLDWITNHGAMESQQGKPFDTNGVYFVVDPNGDYVVAGTRYSLVTEPRAADIDNYYCLSVDKSIQNYVATHIVVDSEGLWLIPDSGGNKVLIATGGTDKTYETAGTYIIGRVNDEDTILAEFTEEGVQLDFGTGLAFSIDGTSGRAPREFFESILLEYGEASTFIDLKTKPITGNEIVVTPLRNYTDEVATFVAGTNEQIETNHFVYNYIASGGGGNGRIVIGKKSGVTTVARLFWVTYTGLGEAPAFTFGSSTGNRGGLSVTQGARLKAGSPYQLVTGRYNDNQSDNAFEIGNGTSDTDRSNAFAVDWDGNVVAGGDSTAVEHYSNISQISLGKYTTVGILTAASGRLTFSIPTGRVFNKSISRLRFNILVRAGNANASGMYIVKSSSGGTASAAFDSSASFSFYNGANQSKSLATSKVSVSLQGNTNIDVDMSSGSDYFFSGNSTNNGYINNQPVVVELIGIVLNLS